MPTHFGPAPGPRQIPVEAAVDSTRSPRKTLIAASFLTEASALLRHTPERFELAGEPVVTIEFHYMTEIDWLAGLSGRLSPVILGEELPSAADGRDQR